MGIEKVKITVEDFQEVLGKVDRSNCADFDTLEEILMDEFGDKDLVYVVVDILETNFSFTCDADLEELEEDDLNNIIDRINEE